VIGATGIAAAVLALLAAAAQPAVALAHAELISSVPADGAQLDAAPAGVSLVFDGELLPDGTGFVVTDGGARAVDPASLTAGLLLVLATAHAVRRWRLAQR
jgi:methionine-rich copper-binding protein CopC